MGSAVHRLRILLFGFAAIATSVVLAVLAFSRMSVDFASFRLIVAMVVVLPLAATIFRRRGFLIPPLVLEALGLCLWLSMLGLIGSYLSMVQSKPLTDGLLLSLDRALGFDGLAVILMIDRLPTLALLLQMAYSSFAWQLMLLPVLLIVLKRSDAGFRLLLSYGVMTSICVTLAVWFPAVGSMVSYGIAPGSLNTIDTHYGFAFLEEFGRLRELWSFTLSLDSAQGILTFPSMHAAVAVLCASYALSHPGLRLPTLLLNVLMTVSTLTHGGHYLVDVIAGCAIALASIGIVHLFERHAEKVAAAPSMINMRRAWRLIGKHSR